jgi:hypothetical protein
VPSGPPPPPHPHNCCHSRNGGTRYRIYHETCRSIIIQDQASFYCAPPFPPRSANTAIMAPSLYAPLVFVLQEATELEINVVDSQWL